ncbi:SGNH/GDSL hydrolase family protein [Candidatus Accumulibacter sp. ACC007]|uniref:SGNH/GDSL hydrolase family protein n=1 Tax=Candidatus Accumulibacter sp. ACC007 TaxID=2823333 RepID=UPI0025B9AF78|nr:SGNH/GDSL hydrolase family protein [Candidatus Accumulibacter sp. ACC007]
MINKPVWDESLLTKDGLFPTVLAIGDSWFWYPKNNLLNQLHKRLNRKKRHIILVRGHNGAEAVEYQSGPIRAQIERDLDRKTGYGRTIKAVFLSGGGNDFAGRDDLGQLLLEDCSDATSAVSCLRNGQPEVLFKAVIDALLSVVELVERKIPGTPVFVHSYDYPPANGKGFLGLGQWLQFPMDDAKVDRDLQQEVVKLLIDQFWLCLEEAQAKAPTLQLVDGRHTLKSDDDWENELHPTVRGFNRLAKCWRPALERTGIA